MVHIWILPKPSFYQVTSNRGTISVTQLWLNRRFVLFWLMREIPEKPPTLCEGVRVQCVPLRLVSSVKSVLMLNNLLSSIFTAEQRLRQNCCEAVWGLHVDFISFHDLLFNVLDPFRQSFIRDEFLVALLLRIIMLMHSVCIAFMLNQHLNGMFGLYLCHVTTHQRYHIMWRQHVIGQFVLLCFLMFGIKVWWQSWKHGAAGKLLSDFFSLPGNTFEIFKSR